VFKFVDLPRPPRSQSRVGVYPVQTFFGQAGREGVYFRCGRPHLLQKLWIFRNLWCVRTDKREGVVPVQTFCRRGEVNFVRISFMDGSFRALCFAFFLEKKRAFRKFSWTSG